MNRLFLGRTILVVVALASFACGESSSDEARDAATTPAIDGGGNEGRPDADVLVDAGPGSVDAGPDSVDAGPGSVDAGPGSVDAGPGSVDAGPDVDAGRDAGTDAGPTCDVDRTFSCDLFECGLDQICDARSPEAGTCVDLPSRDVCTPCSTQASAVGACPMFFVRRVSGSSSEGCTVRCE